MKDIADNAGAQSVNLQQINTTVGEMDRMTQQNAAMVEQSISASRSLVDEAYDLMRSLPNSALASRALYPQLGRKNLVRHYQLDPGITTSSSAGPGTTIQAWTAASNCSAFSTRRPRGPIAYATR